MEEMKNLVIQTLETKGILGQIRAKLRSAVFKVVDDQDNRMNTQSGCGLKWENPNLYKIKETSMGGLAAEMIREYMEYFRMDYSLSVFIPECSISPERIKRDEIHARLGLNITGFNTELPFIYYIIYYFMESVQNNPEKVFEFMNKIGNKVEKISDDIILRNYYNYQANLMNEEEANMNPTGENNMNNMKSNTNLNEMGEDNSFNESNRNQKNNNTNNYNMSNPNPNNTDFVANKNNNSNKTNSKGNKLDYEFEKLNVEDYGNFKKYYDLDDIRTSNTAYNLDKFQSNFHKVEKKSDSIVNTKVNPVVEKNNSHQNHHEDSIHSEIYEEIFDVEDSFQKSADKKMQSCSNPYNISQSGGYDGTVDSNALEKYNYIEPVEK